MQKNIVSSKRIGETLLRIMDKHQNRLDAVKYGIWKEIYNLLGKEEFIFDSPIKLSSPFGSDPLEEIISVKAESSIISIMGEQKEVESINFTADILLNLLNIISFKKCIAQLNYPECCTKYFYSKGKILHDVNWNGFIPCLEHKELNHEQIVALLGRDPMEIPAPEGYIFRVEYDDGTTEDILRSTDTEPEVAEVETNGHTLTVYDNLDGTYKWDIVPDDYDGWDDIPTGWECFSIDEAINEGKEYLTKIT